MIRRLRLRAIRIVPVNEKDSGAPFDPADAARDPCTDNSLTLRYFRRVAFGLNGRGFASCTECSVRSLDSECDPAERETPADRYAVCLWLFEFQHDDFRIGPQAQGRTPGPGAAGSEDLHSADPAQAVDELAVDSASDPTPGNELAEVSVSGEL